MSEAIRHICYTSIAYSIDRHAFFDIVDLSNRRNTDRGVGGVISYQEGIITQILEGEDAVVRELFQTIRSDERHTHVMLIANTIIPQRRFGVFGMGLQQPLDVAILSMEIVRRYGVGEADEAYAERYRRGIEALLYGEDAPAVERVSSRTA